jgi:hypothetical protein
MSRPNHYKYFTDAEVVAHVQAVERQLDEQAAQQANAARDAQIAAWINDPKNKAAIDSDPMVRALRAMPQPAQPAQHDAAAQRTVVPAAAVAPSTGYKSRAQLERERPWLAPRKPELQSIIDPYAGRRIN